MAQGGRRTLALPWWVFTRAGGEREGDGGGLLANTGLNRVGTHLKGPVTILLVLVSHSKVQGRQEESAGGGWAQASKCDGGDESSHL